MRVLRKFFFGSLFSKLYTGLGIACGLALAACQPTSFSGPGGFNDPQFNRPVTVAQPTGEVLGQGSVRVALLTPISGSGVLGETGKAIRNAATMALQDYSTADLQVIVKDVGAGGNAAAQQARQALSEGAQLVIGPLLSASVKQAGSVLKSAGVPMIAFTTDSGVAARGVYLINFTPENDVERIISFAASQGNKSIAALLPDNAYGSLVEAALRQYAAHFGVRIVTIETYKSGTKPEPFDLQRAIEKIGAVKSQINALFIPQGSAVLPAAQLLAGQGIRANKIKFLGTSQWANESIDREPMLYSAWYPAAPKVLRNLDGRTIGFNLFASRYAQQFGSQPPRVASLSYDSVILAAALVSQAGEKRFAHETLSNPQGFIGFADGLFRFRNDGSSQRGLAIMEVSKTGTRIVDQAPMSVNGLPK